jgi:hypothetical protein
MDSMTLTANFSFVGLAKGVTGNSSLQSPITKRFAISLTSSDTGAAQVNQSYGPLDAQTLAAGANTTIDLRSFTNNLNQTAQLFAEVRVFYFRHSTASVASSVTVGNAASNQFRPFSIPAATTITLLPGEGFVFFAPTTTAMACDATHKDFKILNNDGANAATYEIGAFGSIS